jgi:hypothetical protein
MTEALAEEAGVRQIERRIDCFRPSSGSRFTELVPSIWTKQALLLKEAELVAAPDGTSHS